MCVHERHIDLTIFFFLSLCFHPDGWHRTVGQSGGVPASTTYSFFFCPCASLAMFNYFWGSSLLHSKDARGNVGMWIGPVRALFLFSQRIMG